MVSKIDDNILNRIKARINPDKIKLPPKDIFQPKELDLLLDGLPKYLEEAEVIIEKVVPISYGRQIRFKAQNYWTEINIFYGKKGVSLITTIKTGSNIELGKMVKELVQEFLNLK